MPYYITTPFGDTRAKVWFEKPNEPCATFGTLPEGDGAIHLVNGELVLRPRYGQPAPQASPFDILAQENKLLKGQITALTDQNSFLEGCIVELAGVVYP